MWPGAGQTLPNVATWESPPQSRGCSTWSSFVVECRPPPGARSSSDCTWCHRCPDSTFVIVSEASVSIRRTGLRLEHQRPATLPERPAAASFRQIQIAAPRTVATAYFDDNTGSAELAPLTRGLTDMLITDLSNVGSVQVVEREKLNVVLAELKLQVAGT